MSSILLANPFPSPPAAAQQNADAPTAVGPAAIPAPTASSGTEDTTGFAGSGTGSSRQEDTVALFKNRADGKWAQPAEATSSSIVNAQTQKNAQDLPLGPDLPEVDMPDPLPTSPFLKGADDAA